MSRDPRILLEDILDSIEKIEVYLGGCDAEAFKADSQLQDAVVRRLEIIGEAVKGLPHELREAHPEVDWREIAGSRDVITHEYFRIDLDLTWDTVTSDLPQLKTQVRKILGSTISGGT